MPDSTPAAQSEAANPDPADTAPVRVICFFRKHPSLSEAAFYHHWEHVHGPLLGPWLVKHGIDTYTQVQTSRTLREQWSTLLVPPLPNALPTIDHDGFAEMEFASPQRMRDAFLDPYYLEVVKKDEDVFLDKGRGEYGEEGGAMSTMGRVVKVVEGNQWVQGKDGDKSG